jgi:hypothetical protein
VTVTDAERRSVEIKWLKTRPRTDHTVRLKFKIESDAARVGGSLREPRRLLCGCQVRLRA